MGIKAWLTSSNRLLKSASKPDFEQFWLLLRVCLLGLAVLGVIGFVIRLIFSLVGLG
ncbi:MAG: protein translocase SEC61 complex subunit gamma [Candidatus Bathyarchaeia archaeon]